MTIGVGFACPDGIVLGADMEMSIGGAKYPANKDYYKFLGDDPRGIIAAVYSDMQADMDTVWENVSNRIDCEKSGGKSLSVSEIRALLEESLREVFKTRKKRYFQMLVAIAREGENPAFLTVYRDEVSPAQPCEIIGRGNSELARYLIRLMTGGRDRMDSGSHAVLAAKHIITLVGGFVQNVGQGARIALIAPWGGIHHFAGDLFETELSQVDRAIGDIWASFCNLEISGANFEKRLTGFAEELRHARAGLSPVFRWRVLPPPPKGQDESTS